MVTQVISFKADDGKLYKTAIEAAQADLLSSVTKIAGDAFTTTFREHMGPLVNAVRMYEEDMKYEQSRTGIRVATGKEMSDA